MIIGCTLILLHRGNVSILTDVMRMDFVRYKWTIIIIIIIISMLAIVVVTN